MNINELILAEMRKENIVKCQLDQGQELLLYLHHMMLVTGRQDIMFCNTFLTEAITLLQKSIFVYEEGYFDCAFYLVRQAGELFDSMLYLGSSDSDDIKNWNQKQRFPMDSHLKKEMEKRVYGYQEIKEKLSDYFEYYKELTMKSNKIIHKQGFDTFYVLRNNIRHDYAEEQGLFVEFLKYTIGIGIILFAILEPLSLALADDEINLKLNFDFMTESIDYDYFNRFLNLPEVINKLYESNYYRSFSTQFMDRETMNISTYSVVREGAWDISKLDDIEKQIDLLNAYQRYMFCILKAGIRILNFYFMEGFEWYLTTYDSEKRVSDFSTEKLKCFCTDGNRFNQIHADIYMSVVLMYDQYLYMEHEKKLTDTEIVFLTDLEKTSQKEYDEFNKLVEKLTSHIE
jgi:hypothetical protein